MITKGKWITIGNYKAIVIKIKSRGDRFRWLGCIQFPNYPNPISLLADWDINGNANCPHYSLWKRLETENEKNETNIVESS